MKKIISLNLIVAVLLAACANKAEQQQEEIVYQDNIVTVNSESPILTKLKYDTLSLQPFSNEFRTVGTVQAETGNFAQVNVPFDGRIVRANVRLGSKVAAGQALFEMSSPEFLEASKAYFQNVQNYEKAKADYERKVVLAQHGIASQKELQEARTEAENARHDMEYAAATLKVYGTNPATMKLGQPMTVVSPISGEVVQNDVTVGTYAKADGEPLITIANLKTVWINARVKEHFIGLVDEGGEAEIISESDSEVVRSGKIINVGNLVDEETRSVQVVIGCDNQDLKLKHGMFVSVHFLSEAKDAIVVPATAVFQGEQSSFVYVCTDQPNVFIRREVEVGASNDDHTKICIKGGLKEGEKIIAEGGLYLNN